jgi:hypothetical protein
MRQLGARLPEPPPAETDVETPPNIPAAMPPEPSPDAPPVEPYPVEVHRIAPRLRVDSSPAESSPLPPPEPEPVRQETHGEARRRETPRAQETHGTAAAPAGRWAEFHEFRRLEPGRGSRLSLEAAPGQEAPSWDLRPPRREREHHSSFLTLAVPGIAAILAVGALLWSGSLRDRVHQQDAAMGALQEQNQKLADTLAQMNVEQKASSALNANADAPSSAAANAADGAASGRPLPAPQATQPLGSPGGQAMQSVQPGQTGSQSASEDGAPSRPVQRERARQPENRQGVSTPPPVGQAGRSFAQLSGSRYRPPVQTGYAPEIVPPYPTLFKAENAAADTASSQPVPNAGTYHPPLPAVPTPNVTGSSRAPQTTAKTAQTTQSYVQPSVAQSSVPQASTTRPPAASPGVSHGAPAFSSAPPAGSYNATGNGSHSSALAENIETVEGLQRHSPVPLREFHVYEGRLTKLTPALGLSVRRPDQGHGTYALVVDEDGKHYQLPGQVNSPLTFTDSTTHREYALVVLHIADGQVYGYVRPMQ